MLYRERWMDVLKLASQEPSQVLHRGGRSSCEYWDKFHMSIIRNLIVDIRRLEDLESGFFQKKFLLQECSHCEIRVGHWQATLQKAVKGIPKFSATPRT